jgi:hypothetical protein
MSRSYSKHHRRVVIGIADRFGFWSRVLGVTRAVLSMPVQS